MTMDTDKEAVMIVYRKNESRMKFVEFATRLYFYNTSANTSKFSESIVNDYCFVETVAENKTMYTAREIKHADRARKLYAKLKRPSQRRFEEILATTAIVNCDITSDDTQTLCTDHLRP